MTDRDDLIRLVGVRGRGFHGVLPQERREGQDFVVDVDLEMFSLRRAATSDDLGDTVDYGSVAQEIVSIIEGPPRNLIETLALEIAERCLSLDGVRTVVVTVHKPDAPIPVPFDDVSVTVRRSL